MVNEPIAVVGRGCALPGALDPDRLWENVLAGEVSLAPVPEGRWRLPARWALGSPDDSADRTWSDVGGYVPDLPDGSLAWVRETLGVAAADLDAVFRWTLHGVGAALREAGQERPLPRAGLVMGNLSYPTTGLAVYAEHVWRRAKVSAGREPHPYNRFSSGLRAHLAARAFGLGQGGMALDAACASSLYAVALACDRLRDGRADLMVAGGVNGTDDLFLHVGFCTLTAMSRSGRSRPFQRDADGLVPAQGAAFVALMRLTDALAADIPVLGVIRGVGLSNDGRRQGLLVPSEEGQRRAMEQAYRAAGVEPGSVGLIECHATGTAVVTRPKYAVPHRCSQTPSTYRWGRSSRTWGTRSRPPARPGCSRCSAPFAPAYGPRRRASTNPSPNWRGPRCGRCGRPRSGRVRAAPPSAPSGSAATTPT